MDKDYFSYVCNVLQDVILSFQTGAVCTENFVRIDLVAESHKQPGRWSRCYSCFSTC